MPPALLPGKHFGLQAYAPDRLRPLPHHGLRLHLRRRRRASTYFLYVFAIIAASLVISGRAAYLTAALSAILFGLLVDGMYFGLIPYFSARPGRRTSAWARSSSRCSWPGRVFFVIAFLTNYLSGNLRKAREAAPARPRRSSIIKERLAEAGRISASLAHEIRNPLAAISGSVQVLEERPRPERGAARS